MAYWMGLHSPVATSKWMVYFRENTIYKWMMTRGTPISGNPHFNSIGIKRQQATDRTCDNWWKGPATNSTEGFCQESWRTSPLEWTNKKMLGSASNGFWTLQKWFQHVSAYFITAKSEFYPICPVGHSDTTRAAMGLRDVNKHAMGLGGSYSMCGDQVKTSLHLSTPTRIAARYSTYTYIYNPPPISNAP